LEATLYPTESVPTATSARSAFRSTILEGFERRNRPFPWRSRQDPYAVLIGEILLQRTRGEHVAPVYGEFLRRWPSPERLARARVKTIESVIRPLGLVKRAPMLSRLARTIVDIGGIPVEPSRLEELPGVGRYAAHSVPVFALNRDLPVVDWVIGRVLRRYFGLANNRRPNQDQQLWDLAARLAEPGSARELWLGTLDFAASVCKPRPLCLTCPLQTSCHLRTEAIAA
jgi:A/G-specific adenine glycosylase